MFQTGQVAKRLGITPQTVRNWADDYAEHFDPGATPEKGSTRLYTEKDLRVFATIKRAADLGTHRDQIREMLERGDRAEVPELIDSADDPEHVMALAQIDRLKTELQLVREDHQRELARLQKLYDAEKEERKTKEARINELERQIGKLEGRLEGLDKRKGLFGR